LEWKLYDLNGNFLQEVNCQYDALDFAFYDHDAKLVKVDFDNKKAYILKKGETTNE